MITFSVEAKWFCWQNLIVLRMIRWPGPEKEGGGADSKYQWMTMHRYPVASLVLPVASVPLSMLDWWWIVGHCGTPPPYKGCLHCTESYCTTAFKIDSIQFYIYSMGNFSLGICFVFLQILARLFGNLLFSVCRISRRWPPTIASSGIFPIWATPPSSSPPHIPPPLPIPLSLERAARDISTSPPLAHFTFLTSQHFPHFPPFPNKAGLKENKLVPF